ncbi:MAG: hypothetical protein ACLUD2_04010 [Clostridium sp.]
MRQATRPQRQIRTHYIGDSLKLKVKEKVAPAITISSPTAGSYLTNNKPSIVWTVTDADSGVNPATIGITIDNGTKVTWR